MSIAGPWANPVAPLILSDRQDAGCITDEMLNICCLTAEAVAGQKDVQRKRVNS